MYMKMVLLFRLLSNFTHGHNETKWLSLSRHKHLTDPSQKGGGWGGAGGAGGGGTVFPVPKTPGRNDFQPQ